VPEAVLPRKRVLLVDDEVRILRIVDIKLRIAGYEVITAMNGEEALQLVRTDKPDLVVLDIVMPVMDGFEFLKQIRVFSNIPVIAFSSASESLDRAIKLGANAALAKPFQPDELVRMISQILKSKNGHTEGK